MTAIVGILNRRGVAIAADSASTLKKKIINTGNKMLRLSDKAPIAVMVVNNSSLVGIPWEVIIRWYRKESKQEKYGSMEKYISSFHSFVQDKILSRPDVQDEKVIFNNEACSYLVYAGYGMKEQKPSIQEYEIYGIDHRKLLVRKTIRYEVSSPDKEVIIYSEGQPDIVRAYVEGVIDKRVSLHISYSLKRKRLWLLRESVVRLFRFLDILAMQKAFSSVSCAPFFHSQALPSVKFGTTCQTVGGHTSHDRRIIP